MGKTIRTVLLTLLVTVLVAVAAGLITIYTGAYNVAATQPHWAVTRWALNTLREHSTEARSGEVTGQPPTDPAALEDGFEHYHEMCVTCHGAPGVDRGEIGQGMRPRPPRLEEDGEEWSDSELFWIIKHGFRLAGMPAFGPTHSDEEIWAIVGFLRQLQTMTEEEYATRVRALRAEGEEANEGEVGHTHPPGTEPHEN